MRLGDSFGFSLQALKQNPVRSLLTGLGMMIGTASVILVVTISLTSQTYILIGSEDHVRSHPFNLFEDISLACE
jgi:hypothetical protein